MKKPSKSIAIAMLTAITTMTTLPAHADGLKILIAQKQAEQMKSYTVSWNAGKHLAITSIAAISASRAMQSMINDLHIDADSIQSVSLNEPDSTSRRVEI